MKKLPKVFQNEINKPIHNNKKVCYLKSEDEENKVVIEESQNEDINLTLDKIFSGIGYAYNIPVIIKTKTKSYETSLIARSKLNVVTLDNDVIAISDILSITLKNSTK